MFNTVLSCASISTTWWVLIVQDTVDTITRIVNTKNAELIGYGFSNIVILAKYFSELSPLTRFFLSINNPMYVVIFS